MAAVSFAGRIGLALVLLQSYATLVTGLALNLCASINTSEMNRNSSMYQTNGLCHDFCLPEYAFAITQANGCWCSNYAPAQSSKVDLSECSITCPAFPDEHCGGPGVYGYVILPDHMPSGTRGATGPSSTGSSSQASSSVDSSTSEAPPSSTAPPSTTTVPTTMVQTVTAGGKVTTVTVAAAPTMAPPNANSSENTESVSSKSGLSAGSIVGIVIGVVALVLAVVGLALLWFYRRRKRNQEDAYEEDPSVRGGSSGRFAIQHPDMSGIVPASPGSAGNRSSVLQIDPRMDPFKQGLYARSASNETLNTLRDDHDYSRRIQPPAVLRATNPDPETTEEGGRWG